MQRRRFGRTDVVLPTLVLGAMRFDPKRLSVTEGARFIAEAHAMGADAWHSSSEYDTHAHFCECLRVFHRDGRGARVTHLSKIAAPHFEDARFARGVLRERVERQLAELGTERLDVVQWLARSKPISDEKRVPELAAMRDELEGEVDALRREGKVGAWAAFPYSKAWASAFAEHRVCDGLVSYLNLAELEYARELDAMAARGDGFVAIRPLMAGLLGVGALDEAQRVKRSAIVAALARLGVEEAALPRVAMGFPLVHPGVAAVMLSVTTREHLHEAVGVAGDVLSDVGNFEKVLTALGA